MLISSNGNISSAIIVAWLLEISKKPPVKK